MTTYIPQCLRCTHYLGKHPSGTPRLCKAFPQGIPEEVWSGELDHTKPVEGDKGVLFDPLPFAKP